MIFTASNFDISSSIFCVQQVKIFHASTETIFRISANYSCWDFWQLSLQSFLKSCLYSTWFMFIEFVFKLVSGSLFFFSCLRHQKHPEFKWPEVRFNRKQTSMDHPSVPYNKLLTNLASSSRTGEYWPSVVLYGPRCARSVLPRPRANIPRYGPRARLVRG